MLDVEWKREMQRNKRTAGLCAQEEAGLNGLTSEIDCDGKGEVCRLWLPASRPNQEPWCGAYG
jgi:hypothetical protein